MPRLFTGIEIPEATRLRLSMIRAPLSGAKWIEAQDMHVTLRFIGDVDGRAADEFDAFLGEIHVEPFTLSIEGVGAFGGREPRVLWAGIRETDALSTLYRANDRAARAAGLEPDPRNFKPHVTLARLRGARPQAVARFLQENGSLRMEPFTVDRFVLFSARPGSGGGPYAVEAEYGVDGRGDWSDGSTVEHP